MCVKEFLGFYCGHCSVPHLRQCPITASQPIFPPCMFPAERPMYANDYCPPCNRVVWNINVLQREEVHRGMHQRRECECEEIFSEEERLRRTAYTHHRSRHMKGKGRETSDSLSSSNNNRYTEQIKRHKGSQSPAYISYDKKESTDLPHYEPDHRPDVLHGYDNYVFAQPPYTPPHYTSNPYQYASPATAVDYSSQQYAGYDVNQFGPSPDTLHVAEGNGFPVMGFAPYQNVWAGQTPMGHTGAGISWYPGEILPCVPEMPSWALNNAVYHNLSQAQAQPTWGRAASVPIESAQCSMSSPSTVFGATQRYRGLNYSRSVSEETDLEEASQPMVVSSSMVSSTTDSTSQ